MGCGSSASCAPAASGAAPVAATRGTEKPVVEGIAETAPDSEEDWSWRRVVFERYEVSGTDVLGVGNFSVVRRGKDVTDGTHVAVKTLKQPSDAKFRREVFLFEVLFSKDCMEIEKSWDSAAPDARESFVRLLGHSPLDSQAVERFCILELGEFNLHDLIVHCHDAAAASRPHSLGGPTEPSRVFCHLVRALAFLHGRQLVHGDLKPANVMWFSDCGVQGGGGWKLIDLDGLLTESQLMDMRDADFYTPIYAAPELAASVYAENSLRVSTALDVWAAGVTVLEMDTLRPLLWDKFCELCDDSRDGVVPFLQWLGETPSPVPVPADGRAVSRELLEILQSRVIVADPALRNAPEELLAHQHVATDLETYAAAPAPTLDAPPPKPQPAKPKTAFQLFQEAQKPQLEQEGLQGTKLLQELQRRWKRLQQEGGEELEGLRRRERELRESAQAGPPAAQGV